MIENKVLANGYKMPEIGFGTYLTPDGEVCAESVKTAIECGYRHIDTAEFYQNENGVKEGIRRSGIDRKELFLTTKVWNTNQGYENTLKAFDGSLKKLGTDYLDLYLVHWPSPFPFRKEFPEKLLDTWRAFEKLYKEGVVKAVGVCNSLPHHLKPLLTDCEIKPMVNQIEFHVGYTQQEAVNFSMNNNLVVQAWAPIARGNEFQNQLIYDIAKKYGKTAAQVLIRYCIDKGTVPLPKSVHKERIAENIKVFDFKLTIDEINKLDKYSGSAYGSHPDTAEF